MPAIIINITQQGRGYDAVVYTQRLCEDPTPSDVRFRLEGVNSVGDVLSQLAEVFTDPIPDDGDALSIRMQLTLS